MKKELVISLRDRADEVAKMYSNPDREFNFNKETFSIQEIIPTSETTAIVIYNKFPSMKRALAFFYYINGGDGQWRYFFPTDSHIMGMTRLKKCLDDVEVFNFDKNF